MALGKNLKLSKDKLISDVEAKEEQKGASSAKADKGDSTTAVPDAPVKADAPAAKEQVAGAAAPAKPAGNPPDIKKKRQGKLPSNPDYISDQLNRVLYALDAFKKGDVSVRLTKQNDDIFADIAEAYNSMVEMIGGVGGEVSRISKVAGVEGNLKARASAESASGFWKDMINNINGLVDSIAVPVLEVGKVLKNISRGNQIGRAHV